MIRYEATEDLAVPGEDITDATEDNVTEGEKINSTTYGRIQINLPANWGPDNDADGLE